jgi:hypothetical protein
MNLLDSYAWSDGSAVLALSIAPPGGLQPPTSPQGGGIGAALPEMTLRHRLLLTGVRHRPTP